MPKKKPDQVIVHRIELQETERDLLRMSIGAYSFRNASKGIYNLTSDVTTVVILLILYEWITGKEIIDDAFLALLGVGGDLSSGLVNALTNNWANYRQTNQYREDYGERATSVAGGLRNLIDNIIGALTGEQIRRFEESRS